MQELHSVNLKTDVLKMVQAVKSATGASSVSDVIEKLLVDAYPGINDVIRDQRRLISGLRGDEEESQNV